jgi:hypothetical protein
MPRAPRTETPNSDDKKEVGEEIVETDKAYNVKKTSDGKYSVVSKTGEIIRVYEEEEGCEDPKECASMYAEKLNAKNL